MGYQNLLIESGSFAQRMPRAVQNQKLVSLKLKDGKDPDDSGTVSASLKNRYEQK
jgi:hypothetical protein